MTAEDARLIHRLTLGSQTLERRREIINEVDTKTLERLYQHFASYNPNLFPDGPINCRLIAPHLVHRLESLAMVQQ